jgi:hypothetical protein
VNIWFGILDERLEIGLESSILHRSTIEFAERA